MSDGFRTGWDHACWLVGYLSGAVWPLLLVGALFALGWWSAGKTDHYLRARRIRRAARRSGRTT